MISPHVWSSLLLPDAVDHLAWIREHIWIPETKETPGPFDLDLFPHVAEPLAELNNPETRVILCKWASRLAKSSTGWAALISLTHNQPRPAVFAAPTEDQANRYIEEDGYEYLQACLATAPLLPPPHKRNQRYISLQRCRIRKAYPKSTGTLRGYPAAYLFATEVSLWPRTVSGDANPISLLLKRAALYPYDSKAWLESTPGELGKCEMTRLVDAPTVQRRRRHVPCPHCGEYQQLIFGDGTSGTPGIKWTRPDDGSPPNPLTVQSEAWYECAHCHERIDNEHRHQMMRRGRWISDGQTIDRDGVIHGEPAVKSDTVAFAPLSALHSLVISGWGQIAREFLECTSREKLREFRQQTLCETWDPRPIDIDPAALAMRLGCSTLTGTCPEWSRFLTAGIDYQSESQRFPWVVSAWGPGGGGHAVEWGEMRSWIEVRAFLDRRWPVEDSTDRLPVLLSLIDSGSDKDTVYQFCWQCQRIMPCKGSSAVMQKLYAVSKIDELPGMSLVVVDTDSSNQWLQRVIDGDTAAGNPDWYSLPAAAALDQRFLRQITNEHRIREVKNNRISVRWERRVESAPNDFRDGIRYSRTAAQYLTQHGLLWSQLPSRQVLLGTAPMQSTGPPLNQRSAASTTPSRNPEPRRHADQQPRSTALRRRSLQRSGSESR